MGNLTYDGATVEIDDRILAHLQIVIVTRFRTGQSLLLSWRDAPSSGGGRTSIWMTPAQPVRFHFAGSRAPTIDRDWVAALHDAASSGTGLVVVDQDGRVPSTVKSAPLRVTTAAMA